MKDKIKRILWITVAIGVIAALFKFTDPQALYKANLLLLTAGALSFLGSLYLWFLAWNYLMKEPFKKCLRINTKALMGLFAPTGFGADLLRAYFSRKENSSGSEAIATSFMVKFWKFLLMFFLLLLAIVLLAPRSPDFNQNLVFFLAGLVLTMTGAIIVLLFRFKKFTHLIGKIFKKYYAIRFHEQLKEQFHSLNPKRSTIIVILLILSTVLEITTIALLFSSLGVNLSIIQVFIFASVGHSLTLLTLTPKGIGVAEGGGYLVLSMAYFGLSQGVIGSFLILWSTIRVWLPSAVGLTATAIDEKVFHR